MIDCREIYRGGTHTEEIVGDLVERRKDGSLVMQINPFAHLDRPKHKVTWAERRKMLEGRK